MADDCIESRLEDLEKLKTELILDCCSFKLWRQFKRRSNLSKELLVVLRDLFITNHNAKCHEELQKKLHCTRFFCGLSESRIQSDDGSIKFLPIHPTSVTHAQEICKMYPFALAEQQHFMSIVKLQVVLSAYKAGKIDKAKKRFKDLYDETAEEDEEYQDEIRELLHSVNEKLQNQILQRCSYDKFLRSVADFLKLVFDKYDVPFLEKFEERLAMDSRNNDRIPCSFLRIYHDHIVADGEDTEASWDSIISGNHPDIEEFKSIDNNDEPNPSIAGSTSKHRHKKKKASLKTKHQSKNSDIRDSSSEDDLEHEEMGKNENVISKLKESSKELQEFVSERNAQARQKKFEQSPFNKKRWNHHQENAEKILWSDSDEEDNHPTIHLDTPKRCLNVSIPKPTKRRKKNPWTEEELSWLCKGVERYGEGQWSAILRMYAFSSCRTGVDLKDKWRNYSKF